MNFWKLWDQKYPSEDFREERKLGLHNGVVIEEVVSGSSKEQLQNDRDKLVFAGPFTIGLTFRSFTNETMPFRHRGHAIDPKGPRPAVVLQFVEQRYKAQLVQNS